MTIGSENNGATTVRPALRSWDSWLKEIGRTHTTGWRWRKAGWIQPVNISGRLYVSDEAITSFIRRASSGGFSREHKVPVRQKDTA